MKKKAQGLSINVIIVAAIALIVLVVLVAIFTGKLGTFGEEVSDVGQTCTDFKSTIDDTEYTAAWQSSSCDENQREIFTATDADDHIGQHCCLQK